MSMEIPDTENPRINLDLASAGYIKLIQDEASLKESVYNRHKGKTDDRKLQFGNASSHKFYPFIKHNYIKYTENCHLFSGQLVEANKNESSAVKNEGSTDEKEKEKECEIKDRSAECPMSQKTVHSVEIKEQNQGKQTAKKDSFKVKIVENDTETVNHEEVVTEAKEDKPNELKESTLQDSPLKNANIENKESKSVKFDMNSGVKDIKIHLKHQPNVQFQGNISTPVCCEERLAPKDTIVRSRSKSIFDTEAWTVVSDIDVTDNMPRKFSDQDLLELTASEDEKHYEAVIAQRTKMLRLDPNDLHSYVERAEAFVRLCDFQSAILNYKKACLMMPSNLIFISRVAFLHFLQGLAFLYQKFYKEALESFTVSTVIQPGNLGFQSRRMICFVNLDRRDECVSLVTKLLKRNNNPDLYVIRARLYQLSNKPSLYFYDLKEALKRCPYHAEARSLMALLEKQANDHKLIAVKLNIYGRYQEALKKISTAIQINPSIASYHILRGALYRHVSDYNSAIDDLMLALDKCNHREDSPIYIDAQHQLLLTYNDFAVHCFKRGFYDDAIILLNKAIKGEKKEKGVYINRGDCFCKCGELIFGLQDYLQALELDPSNNGIKFKIAEVYYQIGLSSYENKEYEDANCKFSLAIQNNPTNGHYYFARSKVRQLISEIHYAQNDLIKGLLLEPTHDEISSLVSRLFPGKSMSYILNSSAAKDANLSLQQTVPTLHPSHLQPLSSRHTWKNSDKVKGMKSATNIPDYKECVEEQEQDQVLINEKKKTEWKLKKLMTCKKDLSNRRPKLAPLPSANIRKLMEKKKQTGRKKCVKHILKNRLVANPLNRCTEHTKRGAKVYF